MPNKMHVFYKWKLMLCNYRVLIMKQFCNQKNKKVPNKTRQTLVVCLYILNHEPHNNKKIIKFEQSFLRIYIYIHVCIYIYTHIHIHTHNMLDMWKQKRRFDLYAKIIL